MKKTIVIGLIIISIIVILLSFINEQPSLIETVKNKNEKQVKKMIDSGANVNIKNQGGEFPLLIAVQNNNKKIAKLLVEAGADINQNIDNKTIIEDLNPLFLAVLNNDLEMVELLIEAGANVNIKTQHRETLLPAAMFDADLEIVKLLIEEGVDVNNVAETGLTPLLFVSSVPERKQTIKVTKLLIEAGAKVNFKDKKLGMTPLMYAAKVGNEKIAKFLIEAGANIDQTNKEEKTALDLAKKENNKKMVQLLKKAIKNEKNKE
ncbi:MAG: ankyrin repeat domain-containing protein [Bacillota bacterium]